MNTQVKSKKVKEIEAFEKVVCLGSIKGEGYVFCSIKYSKEGKLSICGVVNPKNNGDASGCGQIVGYNIDYPNIAENWTQELIAEFYTIWKNWHLNDMQAGCKHQRLSNWENKRIPKTDLPNNHSNSDKRGIIATWVTEKEHPKGLLSKACHVCGYKYGSAWLIKEVPYRVQNFLKKLKETTKNYAWV